MPTKRNPSDPVEDLREELAAARRYSERLQSALYDLQQNPPQPASGQDATYRQLVRRIRETVRSELPEDATLLVISRGDQAMLDLYGREGWHFPQAPDGRYAGYYPKRGLSVIAHLEALRARGADHLLLPATAMWWLDHYPDLRLHLERRCRRVVDQPDTCLVYSLAERPPVDQRPLAEIEDLVDELVGISGRELSILDWESTLPLAGELGDQTVFSPAGGSETLPYLDGTVEIVAVAKSERLVEARRVASLAVVRHGPLDPADNGRGPRAPVSIEFVEPRETATLPSVSIVIPCHDGMELTQACLTTLLETLPPSFEGEILVVDDASSDGTRELLKGMRKRDRRIRPLRNRSNLGFLGSCNRGAKAAQGEYLLFLNNDTVLLHGWLPPLLRTFKDFPDAGAVGGRLLYPDGRLQEAGCLVFDDGSAWKFGYGDPDADAALYRYVREVDYVSGALLLTPRALFTEIGGLDPRYGFGFYDDDDYCFAVRGAGLRVYYQPESVIVHMEGGSAGTDLVSGPKQQQLVNQAVFAKKWSDALVGQPRRPDPLDPQAQRLLAARGCWNGSSRP